MRKRTLASFALMLALSATGRAQDQTTKQARDRGIRITANLVQLDVVVTDKDGKVVTGLSKDDFTILEKGKKQQISFFDFVEAGKGSSPELYLPQTPNELSVRRIFAFVVDDLTIRPEDLFYVRQTLTNFVDQTMRAGDLVAILRVVGGRGLLQQFTTNKDILKRAIESLTPRSHALNQYGGVADSGELVIRAEEAAFEMVDIESPVEETVKAMRAYMTLGLASLTVESMKQLPGRKSLVLISGGLPPLSTQTNWMGTNVYFFLNRLTDEATRAGVAIHTIDIGGLGVTVSLGRTRLAGSPVVLSTGPLTMQNARTGGSGLPTGGDTMTGGPDVGIYSAGGPILIPSYTTSLDVLGTQMSLGMLASATGGIPVLNRNDFVEGLNKIVQASEGYYLLAYTPSEGKFDSSFRKVEVKANREGLKIYGRRGYFAREEKPAPPPTTKQQELLAAIKAPLARREIALDAMLLYKSVSAKEGGIDIHLVIDPNELKFEQANARRQTEFDVAGFVFDELGRIRGGFHETITPSLTEDEFRQAGSGGLSYSANTKLPPGAYQIRLAVRDNKSGSIGTISRYVEVPDLGKGRLAASSLLLGSVAAKDTKASQPTPITANRQISRKQDLRYAVVIYNARNRDGKPQIKTQLTISQNGKAVFKEAEELLSVGEGGRQLIKVGQLGLAGVKPGRYTLTLAITDLLADKKQAQTVARSMDFVVVE